MFFCRISSAADSGSRRPQTEPNREFASFVDGFLAGVQKERAIPGMVFAAVQNGEILYLKGYGVSDIASGKQIDAEQTLFRVGAISQPVTAVAVMQLAERGRINLDEDVNVLLRRWKLPDRFNKPVTPRQLMTHTAGLDFARLETAAATSEDERNYASRLQRNVPARISEPGLYFRESNMGYAMLGSIIERFSRMNFDASIKRYVFNPLAMGKSVFFPTSDDFANLAAGYDSRGLRVPYEYRLDPPAMSMNTTGRDMARFMIAQLSGGGIGRNRILPEMYANSMMRRHFSPHKMINGAGLGYLEKPISGIRTLQQYGNMPGFSSFLMLLPDKNFGVFFSANESEVDFSYELATSLVERFFAKPGDAKQRASYSKKIIPPDAAGYYRINRISHSTAEKITAFTSDQVKVSVFDGYIVTEHTGKSPNPVRWAPVENEDGLFRGIAGDGNLSDEYLFFQRNPDGNMAALVIGSVDYTYDKLEWYDGYFAQRIIALIFVLTAALSFSGFYIGNAINKGKFPWEQGLSSDTELWGISSIFCAVQIFFALALTVAAIIMGREFVIFVPYQVKMLFIAPLAGGLILAWLWFRIMMKILSPDYHWLEKTAIICFASLETGYMLFLAHWRLLGFMF